MTKFEEMVLKITGLLQKNSQKFKKSSNSLKKIFFQKLFWKNLKLAILHKEASTCSLDQVNLCNELSFANLKSRKLVLNAEELANHRMPMTDDYLRKCNT